MGQIIGSAAKPKRCNLNQLSQLGTPAAGEYILVSSGNSMNAAGQGNFDCYIEGDGQKAATALELKRVDDGLWEEVSQLRQELYGENETVYENEGEIEYYEEAGTFTGWNGVGTYSGLLEQETKITRIVLPPFKTQYTSPEDVKFFIGYASNTTDSITPSNITKIKEGVIPGVANSQINDYTILLETPVVIPANNRVFVFLYQLSSIVYLSGGGNAQTSLPLFPGDAKAYLLAAASKDTPFESTWALASETNTARFKVCQPILLSVTNGDLNDLENHLSTEIEELSVAINGKDETVYENEGEWETLEQLMTFSSFVGQGTYTPPFTQDTKFNEVLLPPFGSNLAGTHNMKYLVGYGRVTSGGSSFNPSTSLTTIKTGVIENIVGNDWIENFKIELDAPVTVPAGENVVLLLYIQGADQAVKILGYGTGETTELPYNDKMAKALFALPNSSTYETAFESAWNAASGQTRRWVVCTPILKLVLESQISEIAENAINEEVSAIVDKTIEEYNSVKIYLPNKLYAVVGDTLQVFFNSIVAAINIADYDIYAECSKGKTFPRYFSYTPAAGDVGTTTLTVYVKDRNNNILGQASCDLVTVSAPSSPVSEKSIFIFGDSLTTFGQWPGEAKRRLVGNSTYDSITGKGLSNLAFYGYMNKIINGQSVNYFGVGGWTWASYLSKGVGGAFRFYVSGVSSLSIDAVYTNNGHSYTVQEINVTGDSGNIRCTTSENTNIPSASGTLTKTSGDGDATITFASYDTENANPLWDDVNEKMSFIPYVQDCGASTIDAVYVLLSWNGQQAWKNYSVDDTTGHIANAKAFARTLHSEYPSAKLFIMGLQMPSETGGLGANYGATGGYIDGYGLKQCALNYNKALQDLCNLNEFSPYCEFVAVAPQFDSHYNMPHSNTKVNIRNTITEMLGTNGVHPADPGYFQIADAVYRSIVANFCQNA